jgi:hypothetical protein
MFDEAHRAAPEEQAPTFAQHQFADELARTGRGES